MSHSALNGEQFQNHVHPHQLAIPGMEHMAHPWAGPLSRGYMLDKEESPHEHHLAAVDVSHPKYPTVAAELSWAKEKQEGYAPGEVTMVHNFATGYGSYGEDRPRAKGLAGALFHSAHHFNVGQSTVPIHSPVRTQAGEHFANKVRPDLKPDIWYDTERRTEKIPEDKPRGEGPVWEGVSDYTHPYQREQIKKQKQRTKQRDRKQGRLF
jgi:hypothetical protein